MDRLCGNAPVLTLTYALEQARGAGSVPPAPPVAGGKRRASSSGSSARQASSDSARSRLRRVSSVQRGNPCDVLPSNRQRARSRTPPSKGAPKASPSASPSRQPLYALGSGITPSFPTRSLALRRSRLWRRSAQVRWSCHIMVNQSHLLPRRCLHRASRTVPTRDVVQIQVAPPTRFSAEDDHLSRQAEQTMCLTRAAGNNHTRVTAPLDCFGLHRRPSRTSAYGYPIT